MTKFSVEQLTEALNKIEIDDEAKNQLLCQFQPTDKKKFSFKEFLDTHPEYKAKHYARLKERVTCSCGKEVSRGFLPKHKKTKYHLENMA